MVNTSNFGWLHYTACIVRSMLNTSNSSYAGISSPTTAEGEKRGLDADSRDVMSSEPAAGDKRSALDAPDTDDDDGCAEQGEGPGAAGPKAEQAGTRTKKVRWDGEACNLSRREERKAVMAIIRQIEEMEYKEQAAKAGAWSNGLRAELGMGVRKWVRNVALATQGIVGGARRQKRGSAVRELGRQARSSRTRGRKRPSTSRRGFKTKGKGRMWRRQSAFCLREPARQGRRSVGREWAVWGQEEAL
jgi:hypothetical protein